MTIVTASQRFTVSRIEFLIFGAIKFVGFVKAMGKSVANVFHVHTDDIIMAEEHSQFLLALIDGMKFQS